MHDSVTSMLVHSCVASMITPQNEIGLHGQVIGIIFAPLIKESWHFLEGYTCIRPTLPVYWSSIYICHYALVT